MAMGKKPLGCCNLKAQGFPCRFGVGQRAILQDMASPVPHLLCLGATPIPRTLELMQLGHLTSYAIKELPPGRQQVETLVLPDTEAEVAKVGDTGSLKSRSRSRGYQCRVISAGGKELRVKGIHVSIWK